MNRPAGPAMRKEGNVGGSGMSSESEEAAALVAAIRGGDEAAFDRLAADRRRELLVHCYRMLGSLDDAEDAVQEALLRAWRYRASLKVGAPLRPWLYRVATNACLDELRRRKRRPVPIDAETPSTAAANADGSGPAEGGTSRAIDDDVSRRLDIDAALATLPDEFRAAVVLRDLCELDYAEIADVLGIPPGTVRSRAPHARCMQPDGRRRVVPTAC